METLFDKGDREKYWREIAQRIQEGVREDLRQYFNDKPPEQAIKDVSATILDIVREFDKKQ